MLCVAVGMLCVAIGAIKTCLSTNTNAIERWSRMAALMQWGLKG